MIYVKKPEASFELIFRQPEYFHILDTPCLKPSEKSIASNNKFPYNASLISGKVDEWLKSHAWKACIRE